MDHSVGDIARAVEILKSGGLVAFPTETVYGLGADAENLAAVRRIFSVKGRPHAHPLILHVAAAEQMSQWVAAIPDSAWRLAERFWPGPLTIIIRRNVRVLDIVTGGLDTVGIRVPQHEVAREMLRGFGGAVAAPSANRFGRVSPTTAEHVRADLGNDVDFVLDGGPCSVGIESTIVDLSSEDVAILRPGGVTREQLEEALGRSVPVRVAGPVRSPGQHPLHYAPRAEVVIVPPHELARRAKAMQDRGARVLIMSQSLLEIVPGVELLPLPTSDEQLARSLYSALREADRREFDVVLVTPPTEEGLGTAIADRLRRAAGPRDRSFDSNSDLG